MKNILFVFMMFPAIAFGQDSISYVPPGATPRPVVLDQSPIFKLAPLSLIDLDPTLQVAIEIPLRPKWSVQQEIGYGGPSLGLFTYQKNFAAKSKSTFRARTEIRYYFSPGYRHQVGLRAGPGGFYVAGEALYKQMNHARDRTSTQTTTNGVPLPQQTTVATTARITRQIYGMHAKIGYQAVAGKGGKTPQFVVDVYMGVGFRIVSVRQTGGPLVRGRVYDAWDFTRFEPIEGILRKPSLSGGVKIGWMINKGKKPVKNK